MSIAKEFAKGGRFAPRVTLSRAAVFYMLFNIAADAPLADNAAPLFSAADYVRTEENAQLSECMAEMRMRGAGDRFIPGGKTGLIFARGPIHSTVAMGHPLDGYRQPHDVDIILETSEEDIALQKISTIRTTYHPETNRADQTRDKGLDNIAVAAHEGLVYAAALCLKHRAPNI